MKKKTLIIICAVAVPVIILSAVIISKVAWINNAEKYAPYNHPGSTWVCEEPRIDYYVPIDVSKATATTEVDGETVSFFLGTRNRYVEGVKYTENNVVNESDILFTGSISYSKDKFVIEIYKENDTLFDKKYDELVFVRTDLNY
ncbi:MAG: hypothetical protein IKN38_06090 [Clostridia bacterium]|nr:hypothetical protein [Clostridia bacterium]